LTALSGDNIVPQTVTPIELNRVDARRMLVRREK